MCSSQWKLVAAEFYTSMSRSTRPRHGLCSSSAKRFPVTIITDLIHDRDSIFSAGLDKALSNFALKVLRTPVQSPKANANCERLIGTIRRECLDRMIPLSEKHLRKILREWVAHYNRGRPHASLGPGIPESVQKPGVRLRKHRHELPAAFRIRA